MRQIKATLALSLTIYCFGAAASTSQLMMTSDESALVNSFMSQYGGDPAPAAPQPQVPPKTKPAVKPTVNPPAKPVAQPTKPNGDAQVPLPRPSPCIGAGAALCKPKKASPPQNETTTPVNPKPNVTVAPVAPTKPSTVATPVVKPKPKSLFPQCGTDRPTKQYSIVSAMFQTLLGFDPASHMLAEANGHAVDHTWGPHKFTMADDNGTVAVMIGLENCTTWANIAATTQGYRQCQTSQPGAFCQSGPNSIMLTGTGATGSLKGKHFSTSLTKVSDGAFQLHTAQDPSGDNTYYTDGQAAN